MKTTARRIAGFLAIILMLGAFALPASASASSSSAVSKYSSSSATSFSFFSSLADSISSLFSKNPSSGGGKNNTGNGNKPGTPSVVDWLKGVNCGQIGDWWNSDSNKIWEKWYCY